MESKYIRKTWPKITVIKVKGETFYMVDARKQGTSGKREYFKLKADASTRASTIAGEHERDGVAAMTISATTREMALKAEKRLIPYGATIFEAVEHYCKWRDAEAAKRNMKPIGELASDWHIDKRDNKNKPLKSRTVSGIKEHAALLKKHFATILPIDFKEKDLQQVLNKLEVGQRRKHHIVNLTNQFFNWCIAKNILEKNPTAGIEIHVPSHDVAILTPAETERHLKAAHEHFKDFMPYVAIP